MAGSADPRRAVPVRPRRLGFRPGRGRRRSAFDPESGEHEAAAASGYTPISAPGPAAGAVPEAPGPAGNPSADGAAGSAPPPRVPGPAGPAPEMGLGVGGRMRQALYRDERPLEDWRDHPSGRVFVHLATVPQWQDITGEPAPVSPVDRAAYASAGLPWFAYYDVDGADHEPARSPAGTRPAGGLPGTDHVPGAAPDPYRVEQPGDGPGPVTDGEW